MSRIRSFTWSGSVMRGASCSITLTSLVRGKTATAFISLMAPLLKVTVRLHHFQAFPPISPVCVAVPRLNRIGRKEECCDQANACYDDNRNECQAEGLIFRDE